MLTALLIIGACFLAYKTPCFNMRKTPRIEKFKQREELSPELLLEKYQAKAKLLRSLERLEKAPNQSIENGALKKCLIYDRIREFEVGQTYETLQTLELLEKIINDLG